MRYIQWVDLLCCTQTDYIFCITVGLSSTVKQCYFVHYVYTCLTLLSPTQEEEVVRHGLEEDYVLKQAFNALVPAFDPRPGRTNVPQIQDFEVPSPGTESPAPSPADHAPPVSPRGVRLSLTLKVCVCVY